MADRDELRVGQVWIDHDGFLVRLDRDVPGDASAWYADVWCINHWSHEDATVEPSDLIERQDDPAKNLCDNCDGLGAFPVTGDCCDACLGGGQKLPEQVSA